MSKICSVSRARRKALKKHINIFPSSSFFSIVKKWHQRITVLYNTCTLVSFWSWHAPLATHPLAGRPFSVLQQHQALPVSRSAVHSHWHCFLGMHRLCVRYSSDEIRWPRLRWMSRFGRVMAMGGNCHLVWGWLVCRLWSVPRSHLLLCWDRRQDERGCPIRFPYCKQDTNIKYCWKDLE